MSNEIYWVFIDVITAIESYVYDVMYRYSILASYIATLYVYDTGVCFPPIIIGIVFGQDHNSWETFVIEWKTTKTMEVYPLECFS